MAINGQIGGRPPADEHVDDADGGETTANDESGTETEAQQRLNTLVT